MGQAIFFQGEACDRLRILIDGAVCLSFSAEDGREVIVCELYAGDMLGEMELLSRSKYLANCLAGSRVRMASIDRRILNSC